MGCANPHGITLSAKVFKWSDGLAAVASAAHWEECVSELAFRLRRDNIALVKLRDDVLKIFECSEDGYPRYHVFVDVPTNGDTQALVKKIANAWYATDWGKAVGPMRPIPLGSGASSIAVLPGLPSRKLH